jgi:hypothetical protein
MSTFRTPVGPQPPNVYWRRRLLVALGVLAVIVIVILIVGKPGQSGSGATPQDTSSAKPNATQSAPPKSSVTPSTSTTACAPANVKLVPVTDKVTYAANEKPMISMTITNTGPASCTINLGSTQQELIITSGTEQIWDSKDCQTAPVDTQYTLKPGVAVPTTPIAWDRTRSSTSTCSATNRPAVSAAGASYHLSVKVGAITSKNSAQFILN